MKRAPVAALVLALALHALLASGVLAAWPVEARLVLAAIVLVLLPGHGWLAAIGARPAGSAWLASGWALGFGVAWLSLQVMVTRMLHVPFTVLAVGSAVPGVLPWIAAALRRDVRDGSFRRGDDAIGPAALAAIALAVAFAAWHVARHGPPIGYNADSPDHIGTIRRMMAGGDAFPADAFFRDAGPAGADPRKGLWHPCLALVATLARADALTAWNVIAALLAPLFVLNVAAFGFLVAGAPGAAVAAWALPLTYGGSLVMPFFSEAVFATKLADQLALATVTAVLTDLVVPRERTRAAAIGLALGAVATHVFTAIHLAIVLGALGLGLLVQERGAGPKFRRLVVDALALGLPCLPYLLWRAHGAYAPSNVIHTEPQGLMFVAGRAFVVDPSVLWKWFGAGWLLFPLSWWAWARGAAKPAVLLLLTTTLAVFGLLFVPPVVMALQPKLGYLTMRFVWLMPLAGAYAFAVPALAKGVLRGPRRALASLGLVGLALLSAPVLRAAVHTLVHPAYARERDEEFDMMRWRDALAWMDAHLPAGTVVLSDPATSYSVPMMTRHWVTTLVDQHSSPNDSLALTRILDARDALDPHAPYARTREIVRRWGATAIVLNDRFAAPPLLDYWAPDAAWFARARARLDAAPTAFRRVYDARDFVVYAIDPAALDTLSGGGAPLPIERPFDAARDTARIAAGEGMPDVVGVRLGAATVALGDSLAVAIDWHARQRLRAGSYLVALRFEHALPPGFAPPAWCGKPARKVLERLRHERYRFRVDRRPTNGVFGVDRWRPDEIVTDSFTIAVPRDVAPGDYEVQVAMLRQPHYPVLRLSDYFSDHDVFSGTPVGRLRVAPAGERAMSVRVAFLQASLGVGGAERLVQSLATRMDRARIEPVIVNLFEPGRVGEELLAAGVRSVSGLAHARSDLGAGGRLREALVRERIDVVYVVDSALPMFWAGALRRMHARPRLVLGFHSTGRIADPVQHFLANRVTVPVADRIVALADSHQRYLAAQQHADPARTDVIVSGVDLAAFTPPANKCAVREALGLPADVPLAGIVAALRPEKNHALFVEVAARVHRTLPAARFLVVGDGAGRAALEAQVRAAGLEGVVLLLGVRTDVPQLWRALDVAVLTSHPLVETLPVTLLEAHACGVPAVSTDVGSVRDAVEDGVTGHVVPPGDAETFAAKLGALLADPGTRATMGVAARARAERLFDRDQMVRAYEDLFVRVAGAGRA